MSTLSEAAVAALPGGRRLALRAAPRYEPGPPARSRKAYAAAHVVADPAGDNGPGAPAVVDWDATLAFRHHLWSHGLGVADAMDTAQRGMGLDWATTGELVRRSAAEAASVGGALVCGAGTDQLPAGPATVEQVVAAYSEQLELVEGAGSGVVLMASRQLAALARGPEDYAAVYGRLLGQVRRPVVLHWLGSVFDPALAGYWGHDDPFDAVDTLVALITEHAQAVDGIKVSVLDAAVEIALRRRLPEGVRLYTGDDFHYPELIIGDGHGHSDALLGVLAAIGPVAAAALRRIDEGDGAGCAALLNPTVPLARHLFSAPTPHYKTGIAFLAWLNGHQPGFTMVGGMQSARSAAHLGRTLELADAAAALTDPELAAYRWSRLCEVAGLGVVVGL